MGYCTPYFSKESEAILFISGQYVEGKKGSDVMQATGHTAGTMESFMGGRDSKRRLPCASRMPFLHRGGGGAVNEDRSWSQLYSPPELLSKARVVQILCCWIVWVRQGRLITSSTSSRASRLIGTALYVPPSEQ